MVAWQLKNNPSAPILLPLHPFRTQLGHQINTFLNLIASGNFPWQMRMAG